MRIEFADAAFKKAFYELKRSRSGVHQQLYTFISDALARLRERSVSGEEIMSGQAFDYYKRRFAFQDLLVLSLAPDWRVYYTIERGAIVVFDMTCDRAVRHGR